MRIYLLSFKSWNVLDDQVLNGDVHVDDVFATEDDIGDNEIFKAVNLTRYGECQSGELQKGPMAGFLGPECLAIVFVMMMMVMVEVLNHTIWHLWLDELKDVPYVLVDIVVFQNISRTQLKVVPVENKNKSLFVKLKYERDRDETQRWNWSRNVIW